VKKTRFLFLTTLLLVGGVLLTACGGQVPAIGAPGMTLQGDQVFLASGGYVYAIDVNDGSEPTTTNDKGETVPLRYPPQSKNISFGSAPAVVSEAQMVIGNAFANDRKHPFFSFDSETMANSPQPWPFEGSDLWMGSPTVLNGVIYAPNSGGNLYAFDPDGTPLGQFETSGSLWAQPVTDGTHLYVASMDHHVYAVDPADLSQAVWDTELDASIVSAPAVSDGSLYVGTINGSLYALDAATGDVLWQATLDGGIWGTPALPLAAAAETEATPAASNAEATPEATPAAEAPALGDTLYIGTAHDPEGGTLYAINTADGSTVWTMPSAGAISSSPIANENAIYFVSEDGMIRAVDPDGTQAWQEIIEGEFYSTPLLAGDLLLVAPTKNNDILLAAYTLDGDQQWTFSPNKK
jgi:outer membrane protein assembly factor BamB